MEKERSAEEGKRVTVAGRAEKQKEGEEEMRKREKEEKEDPPSLRNIAFQNRKAELSP